MPQISIARQRQLTAKTIQVQSTVERNEELDALQITDPNEPLELIYNIRAKKFRTSQRSMLVTQELKETHLVEIRGNLPPLLIDGRMQVIEVPRWKMKVGFLWRKSDGKFTKVRERIVRLPYWVWRDRNLHGMYAEMWIENV